MNDWLDHAQSRRRFLRRTAIIAGAALLSVHHRPAAARTPLELTGVRLAESSPMCPAGSSLFNEAKRERRA